MKHWVILIGLCFAGVLPSQAANYNSPVGTWESSWVGGGGDRATCYLVFSNDFTWTAYGIGLDSFGPLTITGTWGVDDKNRIVGAFTEYLPDDTFASRLEATVSGNGKIHARAEATIGKFKIKGQALGTTPDLNGAWVGEVRTRGDTSFQNYTLTASTNTPGWFDITGDGVSSAGKYPLTGALIVTSDRNANAYIVSDFGSGNGSFTWSVAGKFAPSGERAKLKGRDNTGHDVLIEFQRP